ncbi:hypothetical protein BN1723_000164 [Verticillium longisporum]|uniref:Uncharacterized protein n=1 Tax=Verticillium longisporum TaxID=100787 RepID=A0A0G4KEK7_VERLO|nr:hypothetical protein BN1723_000164 [Verticillium longisporum]
MRVALRMMANSMSQQRARMDVFTPRDAKQKRALGADSASGTHSQQRASSRGCPLVHPWDPHSLADMRPAGVEPCLDIFVPTWRLDVGSCHLNGTERSRN